MKLESTEATPDRAHSSLTELCLAHDDDRATRHLAWVASVCGLCLVVGVIGLRSPRIGIRQATQPEDIVPVVFTQPAKTQPALPEPKPDEAAPPASPLDQLPAVTPIVAADSPAVLFAVPVKEAAILAPAQLAEPPPAQVNQPVQLPLTRLIPGGRSMPQPEYPRLALQRGHEGKVGLEFSVDASGTITQVKLVQSSGFTDLDEPTIGEIKKRWRFEPGPPRRHFVEIIFQLRK
jgi:protein TonB